MPSCVVTLSHLSIKILGSALRLVTNQWTRLSLEPEAVITVRPDLNVSERLLAPPLER